ncbi:MAG: TonB-dependent receptor [Pseudomonadota bacterium]
MRRSANPIGILRAGTFVSALAISGLGATGTHAQEISYAIPATSLEQALKRFATSSGVQLIYDGAIVAGVQSSGTSGTITREEALSQLLAGTGLSYRFTGQNAVIIERAVETSLSNDELFGDDIVVTARRNEELLSEIPSSVFVFTGEEVEKSNVTDINSASLLTPNLNFVAGDNPGRVFFSIRGISDLNGVSTGPTIGFFQDGILQNNTGQVININRRLIDVERVEVLYGPQGTAFGRGTVGGAVNVVTKEPTDEFEAILTTEFGSDFDFTGEAILNLPLTDQLAVRGVLYGTKSDGFIDAFFGDLEDENFGGRVSLRFEPTDRLSFNATAQFDRTAVTAPSFVPEQSALDGDPVSLIGTFDDLSTERLNLRGEFAYEADFGTFTSTTGYSYTEFFGDEDFDLTQPNNTVIGRDTTERSFSQEIRFESKEFELPDNFGSITANAGFIYNDIAVSSETDFQDNAVVIPGLPFTLAGSVLSMNDIDITNIGVFGDIRWRPIDELELAVGARFSRDRVQVDSSSIPGGAALFILAPDMFVAEETFFSVTPSASILYDWTDDLSTYFSFSTGFRPGGFVANFFGPPIQFDEERARNFEGGIKSEFFDDRLTLNASGFALFYDDIQVPIAAVFGGGIENAASARSIGAEISIGAAPVPGLNLQANLGLSFAKFTDFTQSVSGDQTGTRLPRAPRTSFSFIGDYEYQGELAFGLSPFGRVEYSYRSDSSAGVGGTADLGGFDITNLRAGLRGDDIEITLFVENVFNEAYVTEAFFSAGNPAPPPEFAGQRFVVPGPTRRFGAQATVRF